MYILVTTFVECMFCTGSRNPSTLPSRAAWESCRIAERKSSIYICIYVYV